MTLQARILDFPDELIRVHDVSRGARIVSSSAGWVVRVTRSAERRISPDIVTIGWARQILRARLAGHPERVAQIGRVIRQTK